MISREAEGDQRECAHAALLWELDDKHFSDLECSLTGAAKSEEIFQEKGGRDFRGVKLEVMKPRHGLIL